MIVQPDFPDHWKTQSLIAATGDPAAPLMIIRLWAHCQTRRRWKFKNLSDVALAGICKCTRSASDLKAILLECGWIEESGATITVHDWEQVNSTIIARWKGGETRRRQLLGKLPAKRWSANSLPSSSPPSEKSRVEKSRVEKSTTPLPPSKGEGENGLNPPSLVPTTIDIYNAYPRHEAKPEAFRAIAKALEKVGAAYLLERTVAYAKTQPPRSQFTPFPATWFNQERYNDDPTEWERSSVAAKKPPTERELRLEREMNEAKERYDQRRTN